MHTALMHAVFCDSHCRCHDTWVTHLVMCLQVIFPGCAIPSPCLAQPTFNDIKNFACAHRVDFVSAAYIQTAEDAQYLRRFMVECDHGDTIRLIARIENEVGLRNIDDILGEADGIMLCRSSLAFELGPDKLGLMQKLVAAKAQAAGDSCSLTHARHSSPAYLLPLLTCFLCLLASFAHLLALLTCFLCSLASCSS